MHDDYVCKNSLSWKLKTCELYCIYTTDWEKITKKDQKDLNINWVSHIPIPVWHMSMEIWNFGKHHEGCNTEI